MEQEALKQQAEQWLEEHRGLLPLNIDSWEIIITEKQQGADSPPLYSGKYESAERYTTAFYKRISRIVFIAYE